jgi:glycosyltransferase involved in cell wall biosynthesis
MSSVVRPLVSVVVPAYNRASTIASTLKTIVSQTGWPFEIVVVDDGSSDDTATVARRHAPDARVVVQENQGRSAARNNGARLAAGELLYFFDSDDLMEPGAIARLAKALYEDPDLAVAYGRALVFHDDPTKATLRSPFYDALDNPLARQLEQPFLIPDMAMVRRHWFERVGGMTKESEPAEDYHFFLDIAAFGGRFHNIGGEPIVRYRVYRNARSPRSVHLHGYWRALSMVAEKHLDDLPAAIGLHGYAERARIEYERHRRRERQPMRTLLALMNLPGRVFRAGRRLLAVKCESGANR